ncbi:hypothetical protein LINPERPRIM_LOCUS4197 [Linum perenne]
MIFDQTDCLIKVFSGGLFNTTLLPITETDEEIWMRWSGGRWISAEKSWDSSTAAEWGGTARKRRRGSGNGDDILGKTAAF